ncbi:hypothetical protein HMPREF1579_00455 [Gardnerella vaginalis JCP8066]|nr:hypothetical protein HMPREF1579_00455 [Gardnerella vaginalis JCP8066]
MASGKSALKDPLGKHNNLQVYRHMTTICKLLFYIQRGLQHGLQRYANADYNARK